MATLFPAQLDSLPNPTASTPMDAPGMEHDVLHSNANDAIEALQAKVGINGSAVTTSHDYKLAQLEQGQKVLPFVHISAGSGKLKIEWNGDAIEPGIRVTFIPAIVVAFLILMGFGYRAEAQVRDPVMVDTNGVLKRPLIFFQVNSNLVDSALGLSQYMKRSLFDADADGIVDNAENLNGQTPAFYLNRANHSGTHPWSAIASPPTSLSGYGITDAASDEELAAHATATDPHPGYLTPVEANALYYQMAVGIPGSAINSGTLAPARLGGGTPSGSTFLRGDGIWAAVPGGLGDAPVDGTPYGRRDAAWLPLGPASLLGVGTSAGTLAAGDDARFLSTGQKSSLTSGGNSADHFHDADRNRANHIGTQTRDTISNFAHQSIHQAGGADAITGNIDATARTTLRKNSGADVGSRRRVNFIEGSGVSLTIADDPGNEEIDVVFNSTGGDNATNVVLLDGDQTVGGNKTFSGATSFSTLRVGDLVVTNAAAALAALGGQPADTDLSDLADGELSGAKVGPGISAGNVTTGTLAPSRMGSGTPSAANYLRGDGIWQPVAGSSFAWSVDTVVSATNVNSDAFIPVWTNTIPAGETHVIESSVAYAGQTNLANFLLRAVLANRSGSGSGFANSVVSSQASAAYAVAHWTNSGTNMVLMVRTPSNEPVSLHAWGLLRRMTNAGTYGGPPSSYDRYIDFEDVGAPAFTSELSAGGTFDYDGTSNPLPGGSTEHLNINLTAGAGNLLLSLPSANSDFTIYFTMRRPSVTSTLRRLMNIYDASSNIIAFIQSASGSTGFRAYHGNVSNTVANSFSSLSDVWTHHWVTYRSGSGVDGYMRWLIATNSSATGTTAEVTISTGTSTASASYVGPGYSSGALAATFTYDNLFVRDGTNSITAPPQAP